jgi:YD repeat-containing protein
VTISGGLLTALRLPDGRRVRYTYSADRLATVRNADGDVTSFGYDASGRLATITDALAHLQLTTLYNPVTHWVREQLDHFNKATTFTFDPIRQRSVVTDPDGAVFTDGTSATCSSSARTGTVT